MEIQYIRKCNLSLLVGFGAIQNIIGEKPGIGKSAMSYLTSGKSGKISDGRARKIERKLAKPNGWMDRDNYSQNITASEWNTISILRRIDAARNKAFLKLLAEFSQRKIRNNA
jgi:hypothetical protein